MLALPQWIVCDTLLLPGILWAGSAHWFLITELVLINLNFHIQFRFSCSVVSDFLWPHGLQHTRLPCPSPTSGTCSNSCPLNQWCHPNLSSSVIPFSSYLQSFSASVQSLSCVQLFVTPWTAAHKASLSFTISLLKLMSTKSVMPSNHLILCRPFSCP